MPFSSIIVKFLIVKLFSSLPSITFTQQADEAANIQEMNTNKHSIAAKGR